MESEMSSACENNDTKTCYNDFDEFAPSYANLPMEIIIKIFRYLNFTDVQAASLTCRRWCEASQDSEFQGKILLNFSKVFLSDHIEPLQRFLKSFRIFRNLQISHTEFGIAEGFFMHHGQYIENLILDTVDISEKEFISILRTAINLKSLHISNCSSLFMAGQFFESVIENKDLMRTMMNVNSLSLRMNQYLSDMILLRITSLIRNIVSLDMFGCHIAYHNMIQKRFYPVNNNDNNSNNIEDNPSESILTFKYLLHVIGKHVKTLRELDLSLTLVGGAALTALSEINGLNLFKLNLSYCQQLNHNGFQNLFQTQKNLIHLDVSYSIHITDLCVEIIIEYLKNSLEVLKLNNCIKLTNNSIMKLIQLKKLRILDLSHCDSITSDGIMNGIAKERNEILKELYLTSIDLCESCIIQCSNNLPNLITFDIGCCVNGVTDQAVQSIIKNLRYLQVLSFEGCTMITDAAITGIDVKSYIESGSSSTDGIKECSVEVDGICSGNSTCSGENQTTNDNQNNLRISLRSKAEEEIYQDAQRKKVMLAICEMNRCINNDNVIPKGLSIKQLKGLKSLNLRGCNKISDISLRYGLDFLELQKLYLSNCQQISYIGINELVKNCPSIEEIDISDCHNINDKAIECITKHLKRLKSLDISGCTQLTDYTLDYIILNCTVLRKLSARRCRRMCTDIDLRLASVLSLRSIDMDYSSNIESANIIIRMKKPIPSWNY